MGWRREDGHGRREAMLSTVWPRWSLMRFPETVTPSPICLCFDLTSSCRGYFRCLERPPICPLTYSTALLKPPPFMAKPRVGFVFPFHPLPPLHLPPCNLTSTLPCPSTPFFFLIPTMPVVRTPRNHDDTFHYIQDVGKKCTTSTPVQDGVRHPHPGNQPLARRHGYVFNNTQGGPNGEFSLRSIRDMGID